MALVCLWNQFVAPAVLKLSQHAAERFSLGEEKKNTASNFLTTNLCFRNEETKVLDAFTLLWPTLSRRSENPHSITSPQMTTLTERLTSSWFTYRWIMETHKGLRDHRGKGQPQTEDRRLCPLSVGETKTDAPDEGASNNEEIHPPREVITRSSHFCQMLKFKTSFSLISNSRV